MLKEVCRANGFSREEGFFAFSSWIRASEKPAAIVEHLWDYTPPADAPNVGVGHHHAAFTQSFRYQTVQAYALGELRKRFAENGINLSTSEREALGTSLVSRAAHEKSINQSLEIFQTLLLLG